MRRIPAMLMLLLLPSVASADDFVRRASVIDGDTIEIHGTRIRLLGGGCTRRAGFVSFRLIKPRPESSGARSG
jgi:endonuclease YncB( thermonuclease family)